MRDAPESAVSEVDICCGKLGSDFPADVRPVPRPLRSAPCRDDPRPGVRLATESYAERLITAFIRALAAWPT